MLIIANGSFKSGSTWQRDIIKNFLDFKEIPKEYQDKRLKTFLNPDKLDEFIKSRLIHKNNYLAKAHFFKKKHIDLFKNIPYVYVFIIERDIKDTIVSHYHHFQNQRKVKIPFRVYYWLIGRFKAIQIDEYNKNWKVNANNIYRSRFEDLKLNFETEVTNFAKFIGLDFEPEKISKIKELTRIEKIKENSDRKWFFRKGEIGDYKNYFFKGMHKDINRISNNANILDRIIYLIFFKLRNRMKFWIRYN